jgi:hypothetical protein
MMKHFRSLVEHGQPFMKRFGPVAVFTARLICAICVICGSAFGTTVTGTVKDSQGNPVAGAVVRLQLENCGAGGVCTLTGGGGIVSTLPVSTTTASDGTFSIFVNGNDTITPAGTFYEVRTIASPGTIYSVNYNVTGSSFNLNNATPLGAMPPAPIAAAYTTVAQGGTNLQQRQIVNFTGSGVSCVDNSGLSRTDCTVAGGGGGGVTLQTNGTNNTSQTSLNLQSSSATNGVTLTETNASAGNVQLGLSGTLTVPGGGTGLASLTAHNLYVGNGASNPNPVATGNSGQVLISNGAGADPTFQDPIVSGPDATGAAPSKNPVQVGALDNSAGCSSGPCVRSLVAANGAPAGTEYGLITRNVPSGTQAVSGTFWQATQPVSLASLPALATGSNTIGAVTQASGPWTSNITQWAGSALGATSNYGTSPGAVAVPGVNAFVTNTPAVSESGTWTMQPGNTANTTPWLTTINQGGNSATVTASNALKVDGSAVTQPVSGTVTANAGTGTFNIQSNATVNLAQVGGTAVVADPCRALSKTFVSFSVTASTQIVTGASGKHTYFCSWNDQSASAESYAVVEGTGTLCATGIAAVGGFSGGTTGATGWSVAANGGRTFGNGGYAVGEAANATGDNVCVLLSGSTQVNIGLSYVQQ